MGVLKDHHLFMNVWSDEITSLMRCLKCSFGFAENQFVLGVLSSLPNISFVLGVPLGSPKTRDVHTGSLDCVCSGMHQFMDTSLQDSNGKLTGT